MKNIYEIRGNVTAIFINSPKYGEMETLITTDKLHLADTYHNTWAVRMDMKSKSFYVVGYAPRINGKQRKIHLHRVLTNAQQGTEVDHINHKTLDNTDGNLRVITVAENQQNRKGASVNSKSGILGVHWHKKSKKWCVQLRLNGEKMIFGYYDDIEEAKLISIEARRKHMPYSQEAS